MSEDLKSKIFKEKELTYKEKRRQKAKEKRQKDQMSVTIFGLIVYSIALIGVVVLSYVGFKSVINNLKEKQAVVEEAEKKALEEEDKKNKEEEEQALLEEKQKEEEEQKKEEGTYKDAIFSVIENVNDPGNALVNSFDFARKALTNESGKLMDYEVYTNPETGKIAKVTSRENCGDLFEITDYYYDDDKINYIAQYREDTDVPIDLSSDKIESRYYFGNDKMLKYIYCEAGKATEYSVDDFKLYSEGTIEQYKYMENMMLENSKTALKNAYDLEEEVKISGYVQDELNCPPPDVTNVSLLDKNGRVISETKTNDDGYYEFYVKPDDYAEYNIDITGRDDTIGTRIYGIKAGKGTKAVAVETAYLAYSVYETVYPTTIFVKDADDSNVALANADIKFRYGINNKYGETCLSGRLGEAGEIMPALRSGTYTIEVIKDGYAPCYATFIVKQDHTATICYAVKKVPEGRIKAVLTYETTPLDLDLRSFDTYGRNVSKSSTDSVGITTAETITINDADSGTYPFYVSNYADIATSDMMSYRMSQSMAKVYVYNSEGLIEAFPVPAGHAGVVWRPFEIRNHKVVTIGDYYSYIVDDSLFRKK